MLLIIKSNIGNFAGSAAHQHPPDNLQENAVPQRGQFNVRVSGSRDSFDDEVVDAVAVSQTSIHSAPVSSAMRVGEMRTALLMEPAAGTTSLKFFSETSQ